MHSSSCRFFLRSAFFALAAVALTPAHAQDMPAMPGMEHHHHHQEEAQGREKLGEVHFATSCAASQHEPFERGIALLHSFGYTEAEAQFRAIAKADPKCAMAHWGIAMSQFHELWGRPEAAAIKTGAEEMATARELAAKNGATPRERAYISALSDFYTQAGSDYQKAADAYVAGMAALHAAFPADIEGAAFYALSLLADVAPSDTSLTKERKALAVLQPLFHAHPEHPGLAHYIIHTCDTPALAQDGLEAAKVYAKIAPSSPHALHMPGHIFARLGMWNEDIASNVASVAASKKDEQEHIPGAAHQMHADEFLIYAYLQTGQDAKAKTLTDNMATVSKQMAEMPGMDDMKDAGGFFTNELQTIYLMEMHDWNALAALKPAAGTHGTETIETFWGNGVAAGHLHDATRAAAALKEFEAQREALKGGPYEYMMEGMQVPRDELAAWAAFAAGRNDEAVTLMRKAADQQDKLGQGEVDIPANEMLADLLMLQHKPTEALAEYKLALHYSPNRLNALLGAGQAAEALGQKSEAAKFYAQAAHNTAGGKSTQRAAVAHAVEFASADSSTATHGQ